ncbi:hypothetical protein CEXT_419481 [Caerostris extrusa]|uniref:Uncharacterized protein n=1 Tax=Caerostris extrusa TaxID=172846 RepID=A0AAV4NBH4_CAEEX|nr:hypothetical protein CEXT_419481 [Caerostris extrusa]
MVTNTRTFEVEFHLDLFDWSAWRTSASKYCCYKPIDSALPKDNDITVRLISRKDYDFPFIQKNKRETSKASSVFSTADSTVQKFHSLSSRFHGNEQLDLEVEFHLDLFYWSGQRTSTSKYCYCKPIDSALPKDNDITVRLISRKAFGECHKQI